MLRLRSLDSLRFVAAACVAIFHFDIDLRLHLERFTGAIERFGVFVDFFFILSGLVIALNYSGRIDGWRTYGRFMQKRLARVYPLHLAVLLTFAGAGVLATRLHIPLNYPDFFRLDALPANLLLVQAWGTLNHASFNAASWSVSAEMFVYLLLPLLSLMALRLHPVVNAFAIVAFLIVTAATRRSFHLSPWTDATYDFGMLRAVPTFFLGVLIARHLPSIQARFRPSWWAVYTLLVLSFAMMHLGLPNEATICVFALVIVTAACAEPHNSGGVLLSRPLVALGDASYAIYMTHGVVLMIAVFALKRTLGLGTVATGVAGTAILAATFLVSIGVYRWFEDPMRRYLGGLGGARAQKRQDIRGSVNPVPTFVDAARISRIRVG